MYERIVTFLVQWNEDTDERHKLQHVYAFGGAALIIVAAMVGLFNYNLGQMILPIALVCLAIFFINAIVWALLTAFILMRLEKQSAVKPRAKKR